MTIIEKDLDFFYKQLQRKLKKKILTEKDRLDCMILRENLEKSIEIEKFLKKNNFRDINKSKEESTPLITAMLQGNDKMVDLLLSHPKIRVNQTNPQGQTAAWLCASWGKIDYLQKLSKTNADFQKADKSNRTPLYIAILNKFYDAAAFIIKKITGLSIYKEKAGGNHPIHAICQSYKRENVDAVLDLLNKNKVDLNVRNNNFQTPLMSAAQMGNIPAIKKLINLGANACIQDDNNYTFFEYLDKQHHQTVLAFMAEKNMNSNWPEDRKSVSRYGHVLGIGTFMKIGHHLKLGGIVNVPLGPNNQTTPIYTECADTKDAYDFLNNEVKKYRKLESNSHSHFHLIEDALSLTQILLEDSSNTETIDAMTKSLEDGLPVIVPVSVPGHGIGLALYKDKLIFTDRFFPNTMQFNHCTHIFQLEKTSAKDINEFIIFLYSSQDYKQLMNKIGEYVDFKKPILRTGDKAQTHGTCGYTNPRSNLEGLLCVIHADNLNLNEKTIPSHAVLASKDSAEHAYRHFLYTGRQNTVDELLESLHQAETAGDRPRADMFYDIAEGYIRGHRSPKKNDNTDRRNALILYNELPPQA